jgi:hypothetical protein
MGSVQALGEPELDMEGTPILLTTLLPVIGVIIGVSLQYLFSKSGERRKQLEASRSEAYVDYLRSVAQIAKVGRSDSKKRSEVLAAAADAKTRICVYGAASVITSLAAFEKGGAVLDSPDSYRTFLELCNEMRKQNLGKAEAVAVDDLSLILFGRED